MDTPPKLANQLNFNSLIGLIAVAAVMWVASKTSQNNDALTKIETVLPYINSSVSKLESQIAQLVTRSEVDARFSEAAAARTLLSQRLFELESQRGQPKKNP